MDLVTILTLVGCFAAVIGVTLGLFLHLASKIDNKIDSLQALIHNDMTDFHSAIKDFHGRLCSLETKKKITEN